MTVTEHFLKCERCFFHLHIFSCCSLHCLLYSSGRTPHRVSPCEGKALQKAYPGTKWPLLPPRKARWATHPRIYTFTCTLPVTHWAQWEVPGERAAFVRVGVPVFSPEIYSCPKQPAHFPLNHDTMDMLIRSSTWDKSSKMVFFLVFLLYVVIWPGLWCTLRWWQLNPLASHPCVCVCNLIASN